MRPADSWRDYELLDATNHNRLERWGQTLLIRPDPQVIWKNDETSPLWAIIDLRSLRATPIPAASARITLSPLSLTALNSSPLSTPCARAWLN